MVHTLNDNGANSIWEHSLLDPSNSKISRRKPQAKDPLQLVDTHDWSHVTTFVKRHYMLLYFDIFRVTQI